MTLAEKLEAVKAKIKALASLEELTPEQASELQKNMDEAKSIQLRMAGKELAGVTDSDPQMDAIDAKITKAIDPIIKALEKIPGLDAAGYMTNMGGTQDKTHKSFGDFLLAVKRHDVKRLSAVYGSRYEADKDSSGKTLEEDGGVTGGYLVPEEYHNELLKMTQNASQIVGLASRTPVKTDAGSYPALDQFTAPTAGVGDTAFAATVKLAATAESGTLPTNEPDFTQIQYRINKVGDLVYVSNELMSDSPQSIEAVLRALFAIAIAGKEEYFLFRGSGAGVPLGILNSAAAIGLTPATNNLFSYVDAATMISRFKSYLSPGRFFMHPGVFPDITQWEVGTSGAGKAALSDLGYGPQLFSEHLPQANNAGDVLLADLKAYMFFDRQGMTVDFSEHAAFTTDRVVWRVKERIDGQPWLKGAITLADPQGSYTVSPFVYHND